MTDAILEFLHQAMTSPWVYVALFTVALIDGFFPVVPSETAVITAAVFAASGEPNVFGVAVAAMLGAFCGDHVSYLIGRTGGARLCAKLRPGTARAKAFEWARRALEERGGLVLVVARYIPGGRTATTITMGAVNYPLRSFSFFDTLAAGSWAIYSVLIGYLGGMAFENDPFKGLLLGLGIALTITLVVETVRFVRKRSAAAAALPGEPENEPAVPRN
ncbi:DedA family protein [Spongiactinospora sp. TRM90649]|uniref:DedA family protein n=1 Tax=Spongiactinospora sp. TRM90649 TaxID=3031114 RepID=UPI0023F916A2|nr:DedA family protein [Spongiactinospora sp. TRM90649]MDF5752758.1 DedA family protein [Spongiactinospora sp. TRM90649]